MIYRAPLAANFHPGPVLSLPDGAKTGQVGQKRGRLILQKCPDFLKAEPALRAGQMGQVGQEGQVKQKDLSARFSSVILHDREHTTKPNYIS